MMLGQILRRSDLYFCQPHWWCWWWWRTNQV